MQIFNADNKRVKNIQKYDVNPIFKKLIWYTCTGKLYIFKLVVFPFQECV